MSGSVDVRLPAVVLAGAPAEPELREKYGVTWRAEVAIAGKPMLRHVLDALSATTHVGRTYVVGDIKCDGAEVISPRGSLLENLVAGMEATGAEGPVLVATSDIPLVTAEAIDDFIDRCGDLSADLYYPIIPRDASEERFPGVRRTYVRLAEGTFTGGNIVVMNGAFVSKNMDLMRAVFDARKSPMRLARLIGSATLVRVVLAQTLCAGAIDLCRVENTVGRILRARVKAIRTPYPEIGADADDIAQIEAMEKILLGTGPK